MVFVLAFALSGTAFAADEKSGKWDPAQMEKMKAIMAPGQAHQKLQPFAGRWNYTAQFWMDPNGPAETMTGTSVNEMVYGGRFLKQTITGQWMGEPWEGIGYAGYDNQRKQYQSVWIDGAMTGLMWAEGQYNDATNTLTSTGTSSCPMTGETHRQMRSDWKLIDNNHSTYSAYSSGPDGKEFKGMEIQFTRA